MEKSWLTVALHAALRAALPVLVRVGLATALTLLALADLLEEQAVAVCRQALGL